MAATLWATLVGQSVRDVLRSEDPIKSFRSKVDSVCSLRLSSQPGSKGINLSVDPRRSLAALQRDVDRLSFFLETAPAEFAAIEPPPLYAIQYRAFSKDVVDLATAVRLRFPSLQGVRLHTKSTNADRRLRDRLRTASLASDRAAEHAVTMQIHDCARMLVDSGELGRLASYYSTRFGRL